jgi:hypothetical protein
VHAALHDPEHRLVGGAALTVPLEATVEPAVGALGGAGGVLAVGVIGRALVERQRDVGRQRRLDRHRLLRSHEPLGAVDVGAERHPALGDLDDTAAGARVAAPALDLVGDVAVGEREDLEAARVGDQCPLPAREPVQAAELRDQLGARGQEQVERVPEDELEAEPLDVVHAEGAHGAAGRQRYESGRRNRSMSGDEPPGAGGSVTRFDLELKASRVAAHDPGA